MPDPQADPERPARVGPQWRFYDPFGRIAPRLLIGFLLSIMLCVVVGVVTVQQLSLLTTTTTELAAKDLPEVFRVSQLRSSLFRQLNLPPGTMQYSGPNGPLAAIMQEQQSLIGAIEPLSGKSLGPLDAKLINQLKSGMRTNVALTRRLRALNARGKYVHALNLFVTRQAPLLNRLTRLTGRLRTLEQDEATAAATKARSESQASTRLITIIILLSVPVLLLFAWAFTRSLTRPLRSLLQATQDMAAGDLNTSLDVTTHDEIGRLAVAFEMMRVNLRDTIAELELERQQTEALIDASADGVMLVDGSQFVLQMNPAAEHLSGWAQAEAIGHHWWTVLGSDAAVVPAAVLEPSDGSQAAEMSGASAGDVAQSEMLVRPRTGREYWLAISSARVLVGSKGTPDTRLVLNFHDISDFKAVDRLKSDFVAMVSHELRAPLTNVSGAVEILGTIDLATDPAAYGEVVGILQQQTHRLEKVIEEVLQVTRLEARRLPVKLEPVSARRVLDTIVDAVDREWRAADEHRMIDLKSCGPEVLVWADPTMLEVVVRNLLDNARKYTPAGAPIAIEVSTGPSTNAVEVRVIDQGPGIPPEQIEHIFDRFTRGIVTSQNWNRGYGLGLYLARELMKAHNGSIRVENREEGACFTLILRAVEPGDEAQPAPDDPFRETAVPEVKLTSQDQSAREEKTAARI